ncbi:MAG: HAD-IA family hydrolase [Chromatiales bacterium]|nr:HAD-IA family hydrolase [Chromatiales bacterium]
MIHPARMTVLFDLDGTLLDTAPDMVATLNWLRAEHGLEALPYAAGRVQVSNGAAGLLRVGFPAAGPEQHEKLRIRFLELYASRLTHETVFFPGMSRLLDVLDSEGIRWGVVTNKPAALTEPLLASFGLEGRAACMVSGDTLSERKPHPAPLLHGLALASGVAEQALYVGDAERDIVAGRAAGMRTVLARYGYIAAGEDLAAWGADLVIDQPLDLLRALR